MSREHEIIDGDGSYLGDADEMVEEEPTMCDVEEELASLRGEKCYLEFKAAELEGQVSNLKTKAARHDTEDDRTIKRLEEELVAYKEGMDQAKAALECTLNEKKELENKMKSSEAVFNERKRNFDHIITIFGEEKKTIIEAKQVLEERIKALELENESLRASGAQQSEPSPDTTTLLERISELETMLGQSGLARQEQEDVINQLVKEKTDAEAKADFKSKIAREKDEELRAKTTELNDLKTYMGKKSQQWETYKEEAAAAKKSLELRFDERCKELDQMQLTLQKHKEYTNDVKRALAERENQIKALAASTSCNKDTTTSSAYSDGELISLLEEKEKMIEELTKQVKESEESNKQNDEMTQLVNRNKSLEDEVMGLKSLVFKLEHRAYSKEPSTVSRSSVTAVYRNVSPGSAAMQRSGSTGRNSLKFPSPTRRGMMCSSPTGRGPVSRGAAAAAAAGYGKAGGRSPSHRCSPSPRAVSPGGSHRGSLSSRAALSAAVTKATVNSIVVDSEKHRKSTNSPTRRAYTTVLVPPSAKATPGRLGRKSSSSTTPLSARSVNCDA